MTGARRKTDAPTIGIHPPNGYNTRMLNWLRPWFAWRFSLTRLVVAVVFLGAFVGLNVRVPQMESLALTQVVGFRGWPLPVIAEVSRMPIPDDPSSSPSLSEGYYKQYKWLPWTHQTYRLFLPDLNTSSPSWLASDWATYYSPNLAEIRATVSSNWSAIYGICAVIDALFVITGLALILCLQIPRRKPEDDATLANPASAR